MRKIDYARRWIRRHKTWEPAWGSGTSRITHEALGIHPTWETVTFFYGMSISTYENYRDPGSGTSENVSASSNWMCGGDE